MLSLGGISMWHNFYLKYKKSEVVKKCWLMNKPYIALWVTEVNVISFEKWTGKGITKVTEYVGEIINKRCRVGWYLPYVFLHLAVRNVCGITGHTPV